MINKITLESFKAFADNQIILLTHNVSFFNQVVYKISKAVEDIEDHWVLYNICEVGSGSDIYCYEKLESSVVPRHTHAGYLLR